MFQAKVSLDGKCSLALLLKSLTVLTMMNYLYL